MPDHIGARKTPDVLLGPGDREAQRMPRPESLARQIVGVDATTSFIEIVEDFLEHDGSFEIEVRESGRQEEVAQNAEGVPEIARVQRDLIEGVVASRLANEHSATLLDGAVERERVGVARAPAKQHVLHEVRQPVVAHPLVA